MIRTRPIRRTATCLSHICMACTFMVLTTFITPLARSDIPALTAKHAFPQLRFKDPVYLTHAPDGSNRLFLVELAGRVWWFENAPQTTERHLAIDIRSRVGRSGSEEGLLGLAFHPQFQVNRQVFLHYSAARGRRRNILSRFVFDPQRHTIDPKSEQVILEVAQPWSNHNGGMIAFGPDSYLYIALGDGGSGGDPRGNGQSRKTLLGSILRIDVDQRDPSQAYTIPPDNPFVGKTDVRGEIWAYGLRNVWRFSFDRKTGDLWAGDVGQNKWEEIDLIKKGGNYGWNRLEGNHLYKSIDVSGPFEKPIIEHGRELARSITGGYVYRGQRHPELRGAYVYGDFMSGLIWALRYDGHQVTEHKYLANVPAISSFGEDRDGELYVISFDGRIYTFGKKKHEAGPGRE